MSTSIRNIGTSYWLASHHESSYSDGTRFFEMDYVTSKGSDVSCDLCTVFKGSNRESFAYSMGLRPVFKLKSGIKVTGGTGKKADPYILGV